jgi:hypothetical protein
MIVEISNGREIRVPDSWSDERAIAFGKGYMAGEISEAQKEAAERDADLERDDSVAGELKRMQDTLAKVLQAVSADRVLVYGSNGEPFASRVNIPRPRR